MGRRGCIEVCTDLDDLVPSGRNDDGIHWVWREADARDPLGVSIFADIHLALAEGVPQLDGTVAGAGNNLSVVGREGDGEDIGSMADEATGGETGVQIPQTEGLVPGRGQSELTIGRDDYVRNKVVVAFEDALGVTVLRVIAGQGPDNDSLVPGSGQEKIWILGCRGKLLDEYEIGVLVRFLTRGSDGSDPSDVSFAKRESRVWLVSEL